jgi:hypothetical protein
VARRDTRLGPLDRFRAWLVTGPLGRVAGVILELIAALAAKRRS